MLKKLFFATLLISALFPQNSEAQQSTLSADSIINLQNIDVQGKRFSQLSNGETKQLFVDGNLSSVTGTTAEALRLLPSFVTDMEGNTLFRGSSKSSILFNGIPYGMMEENSGDVLIQLPAFFFNRINLSSAPSVETIPDGSGSILSLSSETNNYPYSPLQINLGAGLQERYNTGLLFNIHPGKFEITGKYNYRREYRERSFDKTTTTSAGTTLMNNNASAHPNTHIADLSIGYNLSPKNKLSVYGLYHLMNYSRYGGIKNTKLKPNGDIATKIIRHRYNNQNQQAYATEARWLHIFSSAAEILSISFNYNNFAYDENNHFENENPSTGNIAKQDNLFNNQNKHQYYLTAGYQKALTSSLFFKGGYTGRIKQDNYTSIAEDLTNGDWVNNFTKSYDFAFSRTINMIYTSLKKDFNRFNTELGIQAEHTWQEAKTKNGGNLSHDSYFHIYPQIRFMYEANHSNKFILSYVQRTDRPLSNELNPYIDQSDETYMKQGNPHLKPEFIHLIELSYSFSNNSFRLSPNAYFRYRTNRIMDIAIPDKDNIVWKKENAGNTRTAGFELSAYWLPLRVLSVGLSGNIFRDEIDGRTIGYTQNKSMTCWDTKANIKVNITPSTELQIDGFYISNQLTAQGIIKSHYTINAGASQYLMHRKLRLNASINNIFNTLGETTIINTEALQLYQVRNRDARVAWLTLTYML